MLFQSLHHPGAAAEPHSSFQGFPALVAKPKESLQILAAEDCRSLCIANRVLKISIRCTGYSLFTKAWILRRHHYKKEEYLFTDIISNLLENEINRSHRNSWSTEQLTGCFSYLKLSIASNVIRERQITNAKLVIFSNSSHGIFSF